MAEGGETKAGERGRESQDVRRSVPVDKVLDAVKRTRNPSHFFTGRLFLFCTSPSPPSASADGGAQDSLSDHR